MIKFPYVTLPDRFTRLLALDLSSTQNSPRDLEAHIQNEKELYFLVLNLFKDVDPEGSLQKIISISGWTAIRNRLCSAYLEQNANGRFPLKVNLSNINDIIFIENKLKDYSSPGFSRAFMLGFYAKYSLNLINNSSNELIHSPLVIKPEHFEILSRSHSKRVRIDWLVLTIILFEHYLGFSRVSTLISSDASFHSLLALLDNDERAEFMNNLLNYASSVNDNEIFINQNLSEI